MKLISFIFLSLLSAFSFSQETNPQQLSQPTYVVNPPANTDLSVFPRIEKDFATVNLSRVSIADFVSLVYGEVFQTPYVLHPAVVADQRVVSTRIEISKKTRSQLRAFFDSLDLVVESKNGVDIIKLKEAPREVDQEIFLYTPAYRTSGYISDLLRAIFPAGAFSTNRQVQGSVPVSQPVPENSSAALSDKKPADVILFTGSLAHINKLKKLLPQVDTKPGEVVFRATIYEVTTNTSDGSGFQLALNLLSSKLSLTLGEAPVSSQAISFKTPAIEAVFSALASDGRFKTVSSPSIRVRSGEMGRFFAGQTVRVPGSVSYPQGGGTPVQSIEQLSSGVTFEVTPKVFESSVDLDVMQQVSSFVGSSAGNNGPTTLNREVRTSLTLTDGEIVVIGGLTDTKDSSGHSGLSFLPSIFHSKTTQGSQADIILVLQMQKL